jgi:hypothetical protein
LLCGEVWPQQSRHVAQSSRKLSESFFVTL